MHQYPESLSQGPVTSLIVSHHHHHHLIIIIFINTNCNGRCRGGVCGPWGKRSHLGSRGTRPARRGKRRAVGIGQCRRIDIAGCLKTQETGSSQHQATFMHRVSVIVHCVVITTPTTMTGIVFYCIICFRKINHLVVKNHLHSSSGVREVVSSTPTPPSSEPPRVKVS